MTSNNTGAAIVGGDWPHALPVTTYAEPKPKQTGLDWSKLTPPADDLALGVDRTPLVVPPGPKCRNCGAVLVKNVCAACTELEEARRDAEFAQPKPQPFLVITDEDRAKIEADLSAAMNAQLDNVLAADSAPPVVEPVPALQFEWAQLLHDTADSTDRTIVSARFLAIASLEHLRLVASSARSAVPEAAEPPRKPKPRPKQTGDRRGGRPRANTKSIVDAYTGGMTIDETAAHTGHCKGTVRTHLLGAGVELRDDRHTRSGGGNRREDTPEQIEDVRRLYVDEHLSQSRVAERLGIGVKVVQGIMHRNGVEAREGQSGGGDTLVEIRQRLADLGVKSADVRAWARGQGIEVNERGVIPTKLLDQFEADRA